MFDIQFWPRWFKFFFWHIPRAFWWLLGVCVPVGHFRSPIAKQRVKDRFDALADVRDGFEPSHIFIASDFVVVKKEDVPRTTVAETIRQLNLDLFSKAIFNKGTLQSGVADMKEVFITDIETGKSISVFIQRYHGHNKRFDDFTEGDSVSLIFEKDFSPVMIYNCNTHTLVNCDIWDLSITSKGIVLPYKGENLVQSASELISTHIKNFPHIIAQNSRAAQYQSSYSEPPKTQMSKWRDNHVVVFWGLLAGVLLLALLIHFGYA